MRASKGEASPQVFNGGRFATCPPHSHARRGRRIRWFSGKQERIQPDIVGERGSRQVLSTTHRFESNMAPRMVPCCGPWEAFVRDWQLRRYVISMWTQTLMKLANSGGQLDAGEAATHAEIA